MSFTETKGYLKTKNSRSAFYGFSLGCRHLGAHTPRTTTKLQLQAEGSLLLLLLYMKITTISTNAFDALSPQ